MTHHWPILWFVASVLGLVGLGAMLVGLVLVAYAAISHLGRAENKVPWRWGHGIVWFSVRLFFGGLLLEVISFVGRMVLGGA